ncbi:MAG: DUF5343 domain-containing protein [Dehalococcoidia bacterium]|nr:DUF5343 domain-containing protein [Dehalococcoidia bacterium]
MGKATYTPNPKNVKRFFQTIQDVGTPPKLTTKYLPTIGFKSANDRYLIGVAKYLGFVDNSGIPTKKWNEYKNKDKAKQVMASAIKTAYAELFATYPDAEKRDDTTLQNYFASKHTEVGARVAQYMVQTFKNLCEFADFGAAVVTEPTAPAIGETGKTVAGVRPVTVNINIQLSLPATEDASIYDNLFAALKKHLFS